jgi:peptidoglycan biosynthesis protein MviN/MurJ (putative lipid II flippase)
VVELGVRSFYAKKNAKVPTLVSISGFFIFLFAAIFLIPQLQVGGIALANSISYSIQAGVLIYLLNRTLSENFVLAKTILRGVLSAVLAGAAAWIVFSLLPIPASSLVLSAGGMLFGVMIGILPILSEIRILFSL